MDKIELTDTIVVNQGLEDLIPELIKFSEKHGMSVVEKSEHKIRLKQGSHMVTNLLGTWLAPVKFLPKQAVIEIEWHEHGAILTIQIEETLGFGKLQRIWNKYMNYFDYWVKDLREAVGAK